jgi:hydrogenase maturation protein HypF
MLAGRRIEIRGTVQGVGFRPWVYRLAHEAGIAGRVCNDTQGVTIEVFGGDVALDTFVRRLESAPPPAAAIEALQWEPIPPEPARDFRIVQSQPGVARRVSIPADLATCPACAAEISDPRNRRYRYAFTNCTHCGPRFTITRAVPYDRTATTMVAFAMCPDCQSEYTSPADRRFHAEPNACPSCGPRLRVLSAHGCDLRSADPLRDAIVALDAGLIIAIKGIGGFHLACDAASARGLRRLRALKRRDEKPFAVMVRDLVAAERLAVLNDAERQLLSSVERPIVLVRRRADAPIAVEVAPDNPLIGVFLPYAPLHHLLLADADRPLVLTSANVAEEPIAYRDTEAVERLAGIADLFLVHDREIETRCDDSVARVIGGAPVVLRRARGYVPRAIRVRPLAQPVLACGAQLKNTFCLGVGDAAYLGPHIGDLDDLGTFRSFEESIARMERFLNVQPAVIAHDLHPGYLSTTYALARPEAVKVGVQHHHAHVVSVMAEHGLAGPVLGVAYDGTGFGTDGTAWGGELLCAERARFERLATFRPIPLAGGDTAIREVWRLALALLDDAFESAPPLDALRLFRRIPAEHVTLMRQMIAGGVNTPRARGVGRYFDALGALVLNRTESRYEGQVAMAMEFAADAAEAGRYPYVIHRNASPWEIDLRELVRAAVADLLAGRAAASIAARFHNTIVAATAECVRAAARQVGKLPVVLAGGCFQNARLSESVLAALSPEFDVYLPRTVPPGDGGIALGQALIADALVRDGWRGSEVRPHDVQAQ